MMNADSNVNALAIAPAIALTTTAAPSRGLTMTHAPAPNFVQLASSSPDAARFQAILQGKIDQGVRNVAHVIETIHTDQPKDQIAHVSAMKFDGSDVLQVTVGDDAYTISDYAIGQMAVRASVPGPYLRELANGTAEWQSDLAAHILTKHFGHTTEKRALVRSVRGQVRGFLSDKYRRLDTRPLSDALCSEAAAIGAVPVDGCITETRVAIKILLPQLVEVLPGEFVAFGGEWSNSDFGNGGHNFRAFKLRAVCLNGATAENLLRQIHLGGRLADDVTFSERTYQLDTETSVSALRDIVRGALGPAGRDKMVASIREASQKAMDGNDLKRVVRAETKETQKKIVDAFESQDVINLPPGNTAWRASNAVSWIARHMEDSERRLDLERLAGSIA